ncbi:unnamed protein product, partial [Mesorhabditis spiculigera]
MLMTMVAGIAGNTLLTALAEAWKQGRGPLRRIKTYRGSAATLALCFLLVAPITYFYQLLVKEEVWIYIGVQCVNSFLGGGVFVLATDVMYSVTTKDRRATTIMYCYLVEHFIGDGPGPYIAGAIADAYRGDDKGPEAEVEALLKAFRITNLVVIPAVVFTVLACFFMPGDYKRNVEAEILLDELEKEEDPEGYQEKHKSR